MIDGRRREYAPSIDRRENRGTEWGGEWGEGMNGTHIFPPSLITKWRTRVARTQLEFTARDREFTRSMECHFTAGELVITSSPAEWNAEIVVHRRNCDTSRHK